MKNCMGALAVLTVLTGVWLAAAPDALAHKVNLFAYAESGTVYTESFFPDGKTVEAGTVRVYDRAETLLVEGVTDTRGLFSFPIPRVDDLTIVIDAGMGHRNSFKLKKAEVEAGQ